MSKERRKPVAQNEKGKVEDITPDAIPEVLRELPKNEPTSLDKPTNRRGTKYEKKIGKKQKSGVSRFQRGGYDTVLGHWKDFSALKQELENAMATIKEKDALKAVVNEIVETNLQRIHEKTNEKAKQRQVGKGVTIGDHEAEKQE